jgi:hypothetical protein
MLAKLKTRQRAEGEGHQRDLEVKTHGTIQRKGRRSHIASFSGNNVSFFLPQRPQSTEKEGGQLLEFVILSDL